MGIGLTVAIAFATSPMVKTHGAVLHETVGHWDTALDLYLRLPENRRSNIPDFSSRIHRCVRFSNQFQRHRDPAFQKYVLTLSLADALDLYSDVIEKLVRLYTDADRAVPSKLFQLGRDELAQALQNPTFNSRNLKGVESNRIQVVRAWLLRFQIPPLASQREIRSAVRDVAVGMRETLPSVDPSAIILEFLNGACTGLDEQTVYYPPGSVQKPLPGATVVNSSIVDDRHGIGYIHITEFQDTTAAEFDAALSMLRSQNIRALIVDLRGNPGGLLTSSIELSRRLLPAGVIVRTTGQSPEFANRTFESETGMSAIDLPLVVIVDMGTMSAAEVFAAAMKENTRGTLVGTRTFGKGTVQVPLKTIDAHRNKSQGTLILTVARTSSPNGQSLANGIVPNIIERDPQQQLKVAQDQAAAMVSANRP
ncbi:MAG: S41 family peptidase [Gemmataceae bacterium]